MRSRAGAPGRSGERRLQRPSAAAGPRAGEGLAAHAGVRPSARRRALRGAHRRGCACGRACRPKLPDGQPQCRRRNARADRPAARRRAAGGLQQPAALAQRGRRRGRAGPRRLGRRDRAGRAGSMASASCRSRPRTTTFCWWRAAASARPCRPFSAALRDETCARESARSACGRRRHDKWCDTDECVLVRRRHGSCQKSTGSCYRRAASHYYCSVYVVGRLLAPPRRSCAAMAGRCARWRSRRTARSAISGSFDTSAIRWSLPRNAAEQVLRFHDGAVNAVASSRTAASPPAARTAASPSGKRASSAGAGARRPHGAGGGARASRPTARRSRRPPGTVRARLWPLAGGAPRVLEGHQQNVNGVAFAPAAARSSPPATTPPCASGRSPARRAGRHHAADAAQHRRGRARRRDRRRRRRRQGLCPLGRRRAARRVEAGPTPIIAVAVSADGAASPPPASAARSQ